MVSASPELFFRWDGRRIENRPMKGTMARGRWEQEDRRNRERLLASGKDRAENVMIVDLLRNDPWEGGPVRHRPSRSISSRSSASRRYGR